MWNEPREGTEAYKVKQAVEKKKKEAEEKGLSQLVSDVWFETGLKNFPSWHKSGSDYINPDIKNLKEVKDKKNNKVDSSIEFDLGNKHYLVTTKQESYSSFLFDNEDGPSYTHEITIYVEGEKTFGCDIHETYVNTGWGYSVYDPSSVNCYINDNWVNDWKAIKEYHDKVSKRKSIEFAEDPDTTKQMKNDFGIKEEEINSISNSKNNSNNENTISKNTKPFWKTTWFWIVFILVIIWIIG